MAEDEEIGEDLDDSPEVEGEEGGETAAPVLAEEDSGSRLREKEAQVEGLNRALRAERQRQRRTEARMEQLLQTINARMAPPPAQEPEIPNVEDDAIGHLLGKVDERLKPLTAMVANQTEQLQEQELNSQVGQVAHFVTDDIAVFEQAYPDYREAEQFAAGTMLKSIATRLRYMHPQADPDDIVEASVENLHDVAAELHLRYFNSGKSLAQATYEIALANGWTPGAAAAAASTAAAGGPKRGSESIERARRRVARPGLGGVGSGQPQSKLPTKRELIDMEDDDFADFLESTGQDKNFRGVARHFAT